jgi:uncharacterized protein YgiM (DUF1202 family)
MIISSPFSIKLAGQLLLLVLVCAGVLVSQAAADEAQILVRKTNLRATPKLWAKSLGSLQYGDSVHMLGAEAGWVKVKTKGKEGFVHASALTQRQIVLSGKAAPQTVSRDQVVLAGKGFNSQVEKQLAAGNTHLNFAAVNEIEKMKVSPSDLAAFIRNGKLNG